MLFKKNRLKKPIGYILIFVLLFATVVSGCGAKEKSDCPYEEFIVVDVFDSWANFQGIQSGWFAKIVRDKFNMELNIIAPNVAGGGDTLYESGYSAGNLGDLLIVSADNGRLQNLVTAGIIIDMKDLLAGKDIMQYNSAIRTLNNMVSDDGIYAIPSELSSDSPLEPSEIMDLNYGPYLRWDAYEALGYPRMDTLEDLLPVLADIQKMIPVGDTGNPTYAFSFFKDWDGNMMTAAKQPACLYGYDEYGVVLAKADGSDYQSILDPDGLYMRVLRFYNEAYRMGLVDPESPYQNYEELFQKYKDGDVLFSFWPWQGQAAYNTLDRKNAGKGFMVAPIEDMQILSTGCNNTGNVKEVIAIGSSAKDPQRLADFIDWLYSPEGIAIGCAQSAGTTAGPKGLTWEMGEDGPYLTEFGIEALMNGQAEVPEEWGGGTWVGGISELNFHSVSYGDEDPDGYPYSYTLWESVRMMEETQLDRSWQNFMRADNTIEYLQKNNKIIIAPGCSYTAPEEDAETAALRSQCRTVIVESSWDMVFAESEEEFDAIYRKMVETAEGYGYEQVLAYDLENALIQQEIRQKAVDTYRGE